MVFNTQPYIYRSDEILHFTLYLCLFGNVMKVISQSFQISLKRRLVVNKQFVYRQ